MLINPDDLTGVLETLLEGLYESVGYDQTEYANAATAALDALHAVFVLTGDAAAADQTRHTSDLLAADLKDEF